MIPRLMLFVFIIIGSIRLLASENADVIVAQDAGSHRIQFDAQQLTNGIYMYQLEAGNFNQSRKMIVFKMMHPLL